MSDALSSAIHPAGKNDNSIVAYHRQSRGMKAPAGWFALMMMVTVLANGVILVCQQVAIRLLTPLIGSSIETWSSILGVFLLGIAIGNVIAGRFADIYSAKRLIVCGLLLGAFSVYIMPTLVMMLGWSNTLTNLPLSLQIGIASVTVCLLPGVALSSITPPTIRSLLTRSDQAGAISGIVFAVGTLGSLLGNYLTGFVFLAHFGLGSIITVSVCVLVVMAATVAIFGRRYPSVQVANEDRLASTSSPDHDREQARSPISTPSIIPPTSSARLDFITAAMIVCACSFVSGAVEGAAFRILAPMVGVSMFLTAGVVGVVLTGMSIGNWFGGVLATRYGSVATLRHSLLVSAISTCFIAVLWTAIQVFGLFENLTMIPKVLLWSFSLFLIPSMALGTVSPQVIGLTVHDVRKAGSIAGKLYGISTLGCIAGILASAWIMIESFGSIRTCILCGVVPLLFLWTLSRRESSGQWFAIARQGMMAAILGVSLFFTHQSPYDDESKYFALKVTETKLQDRQLQFFALDQLVHSCVDLNDPTFLFYEHEQIQTDVTRATVAQARAEGHTPRILVIGGGGYTYPRWLESQADMKDVIIEVVEIDPAVTEMAHNKLGLPRSTRIRSIHMDGRQYVKTAAAASYDLIIQDAVNDLSVPYHLMTREYTELVKRLLRPNRLYLLTVIDNFDTGKLLASAFRTSESVFQRSKLVLSVEPRPNTRGVFVIASRNSDLVDEAFFSESEKEYLRPTLYYVPREKVEGLLDRCVSVSPLLTDDYAPVDSLMANQFLQRDKMERDRAK